MRAILQTIVSCMPKLTYLIGGTVQGVPHMHHSVIVAISVSSSLTRYRN